MKKLQKILDKITSVPVLKRRWLYILGAVIFSILFLFTLLFSVAAPGARNMESPMGQQFSSEEFEEWAQEAGLTDGDFSFDEIEPGGEFAPGGMEFGEEFTPGETEPGGEFAPGGMESGEEFTPGETEPDGEFTPGETEPDGESAPGGMEFGEEFTPGGMEFDGEFPAELENGRGNTMQRGTRTVRILTIVFAVLDALCIFMAVYVKRKEKRLAAQEREELQNRLEQAGEGEDVLPERPEQSKKRRPVLILIILLIVVVLVIVLVRLLSSASGSFSRSQTEATLYSGTAEVSDITKVLPGAGTLTEQGAEDLAVPEGVQVTRWVVSNGEEVEQGQILAVADRVSVMDTIAEVQEKLDSLDAALTEAEDQTDSGTIEAAADSRVIEIYAQEGTAVTDTMYDHSALMLLSLDGLMAVTFDTDASLTPGDEVTVTLSDGTEMEGRVDSMANRTAVITVSDDGPSLGDTVTVKTTAGENVGEGTLYIHSEWRVTGFVGTVSEINVSEGDKVSSGATLLTLTDMESTGAGGLLLEQREQLESQMETLFRIYTDGYIYAPCDGVVSDLNKSIVTEQQGGAVTADPMVSTNTTVRFIPLSSGVQTLDEDGEDTDKDKIIEDLNEQVAGLQYQVSELEEQLRELKGTEAENEELIKDLNDQIDALNQTIAELQEQIENAGGGTTGESGGEISCSVGTVDAVSGNSVTITYLYGNQKTSPVAVPERISLYKDGKFTSSASAAEIGEGDVLILIYGGEELHSVICMSMSSTGGVSAGAEDQPGGNPDSGESLPGEEAGSTEDWMQELGEAGIDGLGDLESLGDLYGDLDLSDLSGYDLDSYDLGDYDLSALEEADLLAEVVGEETAETYDMAEETLLSVTPQDEMTVTITVDEMDVLKLEQGQEALVTLDAFPGQSFAGTVTAIHRTGTNSGGSTKYTADIVIGREAGMLAGMNASAQIAVETVSDVLCIPEAALVEENGAVYVYTSYNESDDELDGLVEVTCGVSDGTNVEILSGLEEGTEYYYKYLDVVNYESASAVSDVGLF